MDFAKFLAALKLEREQIDQAISVLERLGQGTGKRKGKPPKRLASTPGGAAGTPAPSTVPRTRRRLSAEARAKIAAAQKKRWASAKKARA